MIVSAASTVISMVVSVPPADAVAETRVKATWITGLLTFWAYGVLPSIQFTALAFLIFQLGIFDARLSLTDPTVLHLP